MENKNDVQELTEDCKVRVRLNEIEDNPAKTYSGKVLRIEKYKSATIVVIAYLDPCTWEASKVKLLEYNSEDNPKNIEVAVVTNTDLDYEINKLNKAFESVIDKASKDLQEAKDKSVVFKEEIIVYFA